MKIGMVLGSNFPPDIRVEKEARSLTKNGHKVYLLCQRGKNQSSKETIDGILVQRIPGYQNRLLRIMHTLIFYLNFYHRGWAKTIKKFIYDKKIDVLHIHDLPLVKTAVIISKKCNIPIVADLHENFPAYLSVEKIPLWKRIYFLNPKRWKRYEKKILSSLNHIIVVVQEAKERLIKSYQLNPDKITIVSNTVDIGQLNSILLNISTERYKDDFTISYFGGFGPHRGLDTAIKAMTFVAKKIPNAKLVLTGKGTNETELKILTKKLGLENKIIFTGYQPTGKLFSYISSSNICLVPHNKNPHTDATIPHKLFQYMLMKKPVIVSNCEPLKRIVNETRAGLIFEAGNPQDLASKIIQIYKSPNQYGENGYQAVLEKYNWSKEAEKLTKLYNKIKYE